MALVRPERLALLREALRATMEDALAEADKSSRAALSASATAIMDAVRSTVHEALSAFAQDCNVRSESDPVAALPPELVSEIFSQLDFSGRVTVSHVCTSWRLAALSDCVLWSEYSILDRGNNEDEYEDEDEDDDSDDSTATTIAQARRWDVGAQAHALSVLLARSSPLPFTLRAEYVPDAIAELIIAHSDRIGVLCVRNFQSPNTLPRMLALDFPVLKSFSCIFPVWGHAPLALPPPWAEHVEHLDLRGWWRWPAGCVSRALRTFAGNLPDIVNGANPNWRLADVFPNLTELSLFHVQEQADLDRLDPVPRALGALAIDSGPGSLKYARLLHGCKARGLRRLLLGDMGGVPLLQAATKLFVRSCGGEWALRVIPGQVVLASLHDAGHGRGVTEYLYTLHQHSESRRFPTPDIFPHLERVRELDVRLADLLALWGALPPGTALPALRALSVDGSYMNAASELENGTHVDAPALDKVSVSMERWDGDIEPETTTPVLALAVPIVRAFRAAAPPRIEVCTDTGESVSQEHLATLKGLARELTFRHGRDGGITVYSL